MTYSTLLRVSDLPGQLCLGHLKMAGIVEMLDSTAGFLRQAATSLYGRAAIYNEILPYKCVLSGLSALWVWVGGRFPHDITINTTSHVRSSIYGHAFTTVRRRLASEEINKVGELRVTSPLRTACDIASMPRTQFDDTVGLPVFVHLLEQYKITHIHCRKAIEANPRWSGYQNAQAVFDEIQMSGLFAHATARASVERRRAVAA